MAFISYLTCFFLFLALVYVIKRNLGKESRLKTPPGPLSLPIIGNLLHVAFGRLHESLARLARQYGDIYMIDFFGFRYAVVNNASLAREALVTRKDDFAGRPTRLNYVSALLTGDGRDIALADFGPDLILKRKVVHSALRLYGTNLHHIEAKVDEEVSCLSKAMEAKNGKPFDPKYDICLAILNTIFAIVFNDRYTIDDPEFLKMVELTEFFNMMCFPGNVVNLMPPLAIFYPSSMKKLHGGIAYRDAIYQRRYLEHKRSFNADNIRDLTDTLIYTYAEENIAGERANGLTMDEYDLILCINDVFVAGFETLSITLYWFLLYMIAYPDIQAKAQEELDRVVGGDKLPELKDREHLPYTMALMAEVLRYSTVLPVGIPRKAIRDTKLGGYDIPMGTGLMVNVWRIHYDEREWDEPRKFDPARFLDASGNFAGYGNHSFLPFGAGRRVCLGESLAKIGLFLVASRLLHSFQFKAASTEISFESEQFYSNNPVPYKLCAIPKS